MKEVISIQEKLIRVQSRVECRQTKDFHDWFYRFLVERNKEQLA